MVFIQIAIEIAIGIVRRSSLKGTGNGRLRLTGDGGRNLVAIAIGIAIEGAWGTELLGGAGTRRPTCLGAFGMGSQPLTNNP